VLTAIPGKRVAIENAADNVSLTTLSDMVATTVNSTHHQNSDFEAQPLNSAYLVKQTFMESVNVMRPTFCEIDHQNYIGLMFQPFMGLHEASRAPFGFLHRKSAIWTAIHPLMRGYDGCCRTTVES